MRSALACAVVGFAPHWRRGESARGGLRAALAARRFAANIVERVSFVVDEKSECSERGLENGLKIFAWARQGARGEARREFSTEIENEGLRRDLRAKQSVENRRGRGGT
jgi:hypothetical protein